MVRDLSLFQKFLGLCAGRIGQLMNMESLGNDTGVSHATAREWLSLLEASYIAFRLPPFHANISKRLIKSPKLYFYDVGLAAYLMGITRPEQIAQHPLRGMLFENLVVVEVMKHFLNRGFGPTSCSTVTATEMKSTWCWDGHRNTSPWKSSPHRPLPVLC